MQKKRGTMADWLEDDEYALILKADGSFQGVYGAEDLVDFDQLPETILMILALIYGEKILEFTTKPNRTIH